jgi:hypothetical protein
VYLLRFLENALRRAANGVADQVFVEHRLACSGEFYNRLVQTFDWRKSDITRVLLKAPLELFVVSQPFDSYPQELCARLKLAFVTEREGSATSIFLPDEDIIEDLCSIVTLLSRRLVSPVCKTRQAGPEEYPALGSLGSDYPTPILPFQNFAAWHQRPMTVITSVEGQRIIENNPPPVGVDSNALSEFLLRLPTITGAMNIVYGSRLYRAALELIESRPDIAYQLLISTVESLADVAFVDYDPSESEKLATQGAIAVQNRAKDLGVDDDKAKQLGVEACKGNRWLRKKFKKFLLDFVSPEQLAGKDPVFLVPTHLCPPTEGLSKTFGEIYDARSVNLHKASPFPSSIGIGTSTSIPWRQFPVNWLERPGIPPVPWFERAVSQAARRFLSDKVGIAGKAFMDYEPSGA